MTLPEHAREPCPDRILDDVGGAFGMGAVGGAFLHYLKGAYNSPRGERLLGGFHGAGMNAGRIGGNFAVWGGLFSSFDCALVYARQKEDPWNSIAAGAATGGFLSLRAGLRTATRSAAFGGAILALIEGAVILMNRLPGLPAPPLEDQIPSAGTPAGFPSMPAEPQSSTQGWLDFLKPTESSANSNTDGAKSSGSGWLDFLPESKRSSETLETAPADSGLHPPATAQVSATNQGSWLGGLFGKGKQQSQHTSEKESGIRDSFDWNPAPPVPSFELK